MKNIAMCGLNCASCEAFIASQTNDDELRKRAAEKWTKEYNQPGDPPVKPEEINCCGCLSDGPLYNHCYQCEIRKCGLAKGLKNCGECGEYRCEKLVRLQERIPGTKENCDVIKKESS